MHLATMTTALLIAGGIGAVGPVPGPAVAAIEWTLTAGLGDGVALILGPMGTVMPNDTLMASADRIFLEPLGFTGHTEGVATPYSFSFSGYDWDATVAQGVTNLVDAVKTQIADGHVSAEDPLVIFGYSQGTTIATQAMQQLVDAGVPADYLHFVLTGHAASAFGGFLNAFVPSLPDWLQEPVRQFLDFINLGDLIGATTPDGPYATDVYTLPGDGWSDWPSSVTADPSATWDALIGAFSVHLAYFGLTPEQVGDAVLTHTDGTADYFTIPDAHIDWLTTLWNSAINVGDIPAWLAGL
ncbi:PE-PPE domain-containing protein [Mycolicibacter acidiphilus]|nr:PE-PPE domain-containing protein [Mycolicibacter acidiphilus]